MLALADAGERSLRQSGASGAAGSQKRRRFPGAAGRAALGSCWTQPGLSVAQGPEGRGSSWGGHTKPRVLCQPVQEGGLLLSPVFQGVGCAQAVLPCWCCWRHLREPPAPTASHLD